MVLRLVPETEERDSNSSQGRRLTFNGRDHQISQGWQGRRGDCGSSHSPLSPRHGVSGRERRKEERSPFTTLVLFLFFRFLHFSSKKNIFVLMYMKASYG